MPGLRPVSGSLACLASILFALAFPLDHPTPKAPDAPSVRRLGGRWFVSDHGLEESPGSTGIGCRLMAGGGDLRESATENKPPRRGDTPR